MITDYDHDLAPGMAVFTKKGDGFYHVGYYIGITAEYGFTVVEARDSNSGVICSSLEGSNFTYFTMLKGIDYIYNWDESAAQGVKMNE